MDGWILVKFKHFKTHHSVKHNALIKTNASSRGIDDRQAIGTEVESTRNN